MAQTSNGAKNGAQAVETTGTHFETRTMRVKFMGTDRQSHTMTYVQRAVGVTGVARHFTLTVKMTPKFWRKVLKAGPLPTGKMVNLTLEQTIDDDRVCTYATDFFLTPDAVELSLVSNATKSAG